MKIVYICLRKVLGIHKNIAREQVLTIAQQECSRQGWVWETPVHIREDLRTYWVWTKSDYRGGNCSLVIDLQSGRVIRANLIRR